VDILARILADTFDIRDFLTIILTRMSCGCYEEMGPVEFQLIVTSCIKQYCTVYPETQGPKFVITV